MIGQRRFTIHVWNIFRERQKMQKVQRATRKAAGKLKTEAECITDKKHREERKYSASLQGFEELTIMEIGRKEEG